MSETEPQQATTTEQRIRALREAIPGHAAMAADLIRRNREARDSGINLKTYSDEEILEGACHRLYQKAAAILEDDARLLPIPNNSGAAWERFDRLQAWCENCLASVANRSQLGNLLPIGTMAGRMGVSAKWLRNEAKAGRIPHMKAGNRLLFDSETIQRLLIERAKKPAN